MRFRFVHAADLHLDSPMRGLSTRDPALGRLFADATRRAFSTLVTRTIEAEAAFLLIAGDLYDRDWKDHATGLYAARELARLTRAGIPVVMVSGNHDAESVLTRTIRYPDGVTMLPTDRAGTVRLDQCGVAIHGRGFADRAVPDALVRSFPAAMPGLFNIGLLHTSLDGRAGHAPYAPASIAELSARGYDYWALGHVHAREIVARAPFIVFPGNIQGRSIRETGAKGAMLVEVEDGRIAAADFFATDVARFASLAIDATGHDDVAAILDHVREAARAAAADLPVAARLTIRGKTPAYDAILAARAQFEADALAALAEAGDIWLERLVLSIEAVTARPPIDDGLDAAGLLAAADDDPATAATMAALIDALRARLPDEARPGFEAMLAEEDEAIRAEAMALALHRLGSAGA